MDGKTLATVAVFASVCNGGSDGAYEPQIQQIGTCQVAPDYGTAWVESADPDGDKLMVYVDYEGCSDAEITLCWSGELFHDPEGPTAVGHIGMDLADVTDCPTSTVNKAVWYDVSALRQQAAVEFPDADVVRVWIDGEIAEFPL